MARSSYFKPNDPPAGKAGASGVSERSTRQAWESFVSSGRSDEARPRNVREPVLDHLWVEWAFSLPSSLQPEPKAILRAVLARHVPVELWSRPKKGFAVPLADWLRGPLRDWGQSLMDGRLQDVPILDSPEVRRLWEAHVSGKTSFSAAIWPVLMLLAWLEARDPGRL